MPARSKKQQMAAGAALAAKRGERSKASLKGASREMVETMSEQQLRAGDRRTGAVGGDRRAEPSAPVHIFLGTDATSGPAPEGGCQEDVMPARSKKQQMAAGAALAAKRGERSKASLKGASREMVETMSEQQLREFASTKRRSLPRKRR